MAKFHTQLVVQAYGDDLWRVQEPLRYQTDLLPSVIVVPEGFFTDFASVPRVPLAYLIAGGVGEPAAVVHDYLYQTQSTVRVVADRIYQEALGVLGVVWWRRKLMYWAVRLFGHWAYVR